MWKGFLIYDFLLLKPNLKIEGIDISRYTIENSKSEIKHLLTEAKARICHTKIIALIILYLLILYIILIEKNVLEH